MSNKASYKRLTKEYKAIVNNPIPFIIAKPLESNILEWHYIITGPPETPYSGGQYHGKLVFPNDYPFKPPSIMMITPNGRFETNTRLCLSISDFHPDTWNPAWSVSTILNGLLSFMNSDDITTGSIKTSSEEKAKLAKLSMKYNFKNKKFIGNLFQITVANC
ncbi:UBC-like protein [Neoconidiobolus thromboides FSU 785]|nr:UBC-like protein [Neoconidiobolus thromboides FSU 785]